MPNGRIVRVQKESFLNLVEGFLNGPYRVYLAASRLTQKKEFGCDHCPSTIKTVSPDDVYTVLKRYL
jgi:hypothetical protein